MPARYHLKDCDDCEHGDDPQVCTACEILAMDMKIRRLELKLEMAKSMLTDDQLIKLEG